MASSSNRKSNSSASSQKPTFRRSKGAASRPGAPAPRPAARPKPAARPVAAQPPKATKSSYTASAKPSAPRAKAAPKPAAPKPTVRKASAVKAAPARPRPKASGAAPAPRLRAASGSADTRALAKANARPSARGAGSRPAPATASPAAKRPVRVPAAKPQPAAPSAAPASARASAAAPGNRLAVALAAIVALALALGIGGVAVANSPLLAATEIEVKGSEHVSEDDMRRMLDVPEGSTLLNIDEEELAASLKRNPWVDTVDIQREFPHKLIVAPREHKVAAIAYIAAEDIAWAVSESGTWIAPMSLSVTVDADGAVIESAGAGDALPAAGADDGSDADPDAAGSGDGASDGADADAADGAADPDASGTEGGEGEPGTDGAAADPVDPDASATGSLTGVDAALALARDAGALLLIDVGADVAPSSGAEVSSDVVKAGLAYAKGFSSEFLAQVKDLSVPSLEAISANLVSGVEVSLGAPENIGTKEQVVTRLLSERSGVTYINVRTPDAYTFRSADLDG